MICPFAFDDGAYVLGALSPADRAAYEKHLPSCGACREAVAELAVLPGLLRRLKQPAEESVAVGDRVPALMTELKKRRRRSAAAVFASFCAALAITVGAMSAPWTALSSRPTGTPSASPSAGPEMIAMKQVLMETYVTAEASLSGSGSGTLITMHCAYPPNGKPAKAWTFRLVAVGADGTEEQVGSWKAAPGEEVTITGTVQFGHGAIARLELRSRDGTALLILTVSGG